MDYKGTGIIDYLEKILLYCIGVLNAILLVVVSLQVISRSLYISIAWTEEIAMFILCYLVFLGAAIGVKNNEHFCITVVSTKLPRRYSKYLSVGIQIVVIALLVLMGWSGILFFQAGMRAIFPVTHMVKGWLFIIMPISVLIMLFYAIVNLIKTLLRAG